MRALARILCLGTAVFAINQGAFAQEPERGGILRFATSGEAPTYDCQATTTNDVIHALAPLYSGLIKFDPENYPEIVGDLATGWEVSEDGLTYTFSLREGVTFHDGTPFSARDVKATFDRIRNPPEGVVSVRQARYEAIEEIEILDDHTVAFRLSEADNTMITTLALPWNCILSAEHLEGDPNFPERNIIGTGPFKFVEHVPGSHFSAERNENYFQDGKPYLDGYHISFLSTSAVVNAIKGRQIDTFFVGVNPPEAADLTATMGDAVRVDEGLILCKLDLFFNTQVAPFDDARVRRALNLAVDRWGGGPALSRISRMDLPGSVVPPGGALATPDDELAELPGFYRDVQAARAEARELLQEAGVTNLGFQLTTRAVESLVPISIFLADAWRQIGVTAEPLPLPTAQQRAAYSAGNYQVGFDSNCVEADEPNYSLLNYVSHDISPLNYSHYIDRTLDELYEKQRQATDEQERIGYIREFERHLAEQSYAFPLFWWRRLVPLNAAIQGWEMLPSPHLNQDLTEVWFDRSQGY